jgi:hypothetical protein
MSLEFPPVGIDAANTWLKDNEDTVTGYHGSTSKELTSYKTVVENAPYGNGAYKAWTTDTYSGYSDSISYGSNEWPASGAFDKSEGDSSTQLSYHTGRTYSNSSDNSNPGYLALEMPLKIKLTSYSVKNRPGFQASQAPKKWTLAGRSGDGADWEDIQTETVSSWTSGETKTWTVSTTKYYSDFRFAWFQAMGNGNYISLYTIKLYGVPYHISSSSEIRFSEFGNLPLPRFQSIFSNSKKEIKFSQLQEALKDITDVASGTKSLALLRSPTMYCGKFYIGNSVSTTIYFPTAFASVPGVFITPQWRNYNFVTNSSETITTIRITAVYTTHFTVTNTETDFDPFIHWMAVKTGTGTIYGAAYNCEVQSTGSNWGSYRTHYYSGLGTPIPICTQNSANNSLTLWGRSNTITSTYTGWYIGKPGYSPVTTQYTTANSENFAFLAITNTNVFKKMYMFAGTANASEDTEAVYTNTKPLHNPIVIASTTTAGGDSAQVHCRRLTSKRAKYIIRETPGMDGPHGNCSIYAIHLRGFSDFGSKPFWHLDANFINTNQKVSNSGEIKRWRNSSGRAFKYAVGKGTSRPTLGTDSDGYYVYFNKSQSQYFKIRNTIKWKFVDGDGSGTGGVTAFCVFKFINSSSQSWPRFFDFGNGDGVDNVIWARYETGNETRFEIHDPLVTYDTTNGLVSSSWQIYTVKYDNSDLECFFWSDGMKWTPNETATATATDRNTTLNYIGESNWSQDDFLDGYMREQIVFNDSLNNSQIRSINMRLGKKWNIPTWTLLFRQTIGYWWTSSQSLSLNSSDPDNDNYSILDQINTYKNTDGKYRLRYLDTGDSSTAGRFNDWRQTSNFTTTSDSVSGYEAVSVYDTGASWGGLSKSSSSYARFDGSPGNGNWWFAVATITSAWDGGRIPALNTTSQMEVYIMKEN